MWAVLYWFFEGAPDSQHIQVLCWFRDTEDISRVVFTGTAETKNLENTQSKVGSVQMLAYREGGAGICRETRRRKCPR